MPFVYGLTDPLFAGPVLDAVRYIGKTDNPMRRYKQHCRADDYSTKSNWIKSLKAANLLPGLVIIETVERNIDERERYWIAYYLEKGVELLNVDMAYKPAVRLPHVSFIDREKLGILLMEAHNRKINDADGFSLSKLARQVNAGQGHISRIVHGKTLPSRSLLIKICKALDCGMSEVEEIFNRTDYRQPTQEEIEEESVA
jgi:DNA-binding XRE family transcriptional regulator/predicted GIY-YIG superfamily endonuclease